MWHQLIQLLGVKRKNGRARASIGMEELPTRELPSHGFLGSNMDAQVDAPEDRSHALTSRAAVLLDLVPNTATGEQQSEAQKDVPKEWSGI